MSTTHRSVLGIVGNCLAGLLVAAMGHPARATPSAQGWEWRNPLPHGSGLWQLVECDGRLIATGRAGTIQTTEDGVTWTQRVSGTRQHLLSAAAEGTTVVAVGAEGDVVTSRDGGHTWAVTFSTSSRWATVVRATGQWIALGHDMATSPDGLSWTQRDPPESGLYYSSALWTGTRLVVGGASYVSPGPRSGLFYSDDAREWHRCPVDVPDFAGVRLVAWTGSRMAALISNKMVVSADGLNWTPANPEGVETLNELLWTGSEFLAVPQSMETCFTSPNGESWTTRNLHAANPDMWVTTAAIYGPEILLGGTHGYLLHSTDRGETWHPRASGLEGTVHAIHRIAGRWVVAGSDGGVASSPDGVQWVPHATGTQALLDSLAWHDGLWVAGGRVDSGADREHKRFGIFTSPDGRQWTDRSFTAGANQWWNSLVHEVFHTGERWMAVANDAVLTSVDATTWEVQEFSHRTVAAAWNGSRLVTIDVKPEDDPALVRYSDDNGRTWQVVWELAGFPTKVQWSGSSFVVLSGNRLYHSSTGSPGSWKQKALPPNVFPSALHADHDGMVVAGSQWSPEGRKSAAMLMSRDGAAWTRCDAPTALEISHVTRAGSLYVATGMDGAVVTSGDGITWTEWATPTTHELYASAWNGQELLVVGEGGTILAHPAPTAVVPWTSIAKSDVGGFPVRLTWRAVPGRRYDIESTTTLGLPWIPVPGSPRTAVALDESFDYEEIDDPAPAQRFFRLLQRP